MGFFTGLTIAKDYKCSNSFITRNLPKLMNKGYVKIYLEKAHNRARRYMISQRGKILVTKFYKKLKEYIKNWDGKKNLILITHYVVILSLLNIGVSSGEIVVVDKDLNVIGRVETFK